MAIRRILKYSANSQLDKAEAELISALVPAVKCSHRTMRYSQTSDR
jgi:hypothetical protein